MLSKQPDLGVWRRTSPFAVVFFLGATIKTIAGNYIHLAASLGAIAYATRFEFLPGDLSIGWALLIVLLAIGTVALLRYWFFRFRLEEDRILIHQGFLKRTALDLPFDRIQGINFERSLVNRVLGLVTIRLDTAGTIVAEGRLPSVSTELADWLRTRVDRRRRQGSAGDREHAEGGRPLASDPLDVAEDRLQSRPRELTPVHEQVLLRLTNGDMFRIGLSDRKALVLAGAVFALTEAAEPVQRVIAGVVDSMRTSAAELGTLGQGIAVAALGFAALFVFMAAVVVSAFLRYHGFTLWRQGTAYRSRGGLLTQKEVVVETDKVQQLTLSQNLVMRWFGRYRLAALPAGGAPVQGGEAPAALEVADNLGIPLLDGSLAERLRSRVFGQEAEGLTLLPLSPAFTRVSPHYIRALAIRIAVLPILAGTLLVFASSGPGAPAGIAVGIWCIACLLFSGLIAWQCWSRRGYLHDRDGLASRSGLIGRKVDAFLFRKAQGVAVKQSPLQHRKGLATLEVQLASGVVTVPYIDHGAACRLRDYILYKVESSHQRWH